MSGVSQTVAIVTVSKTVSMSVVSQTVAVSVSETVSASVVSQSVAVVGIGIGLSLWLGIGGPLGDMDDSGRVGDITTGGGVSSDMDGGRGGVGGDSVVAESVVSQTGVSVSS